MRALLFASLVLLAACGGSSTDDDAGSTTSSSSSSSTGGVDTGPPSGTATLSGGAAFEVKSAFFRWGTGSDGSVSTDNAQISLADVEGTCAQFQKGLDDYYQTLRILGINPRVVEGALEVGDYDSNTDPFKAGSHYVGYIHVSQGGAASTPDYEGMQTTLTAVADDALEGSFTINWADGTEPLKGTFSVPLCGPSP